MIVSNKNMDWDSFSRYLFYERKMSRSPSSVGALKSRFKILTTYFVDKDFTRDNFNNFIASLEEKKYSVSYINNFIKLVKLMDKYLKMSEFADYTFFYEKENKDLEPFTEEEITQISEITLPYRFFTQELNFRDMVMIQFAFLTGFRKGEIIGLTWNDVRNAPIPHVVARDTKNGEDHELPISRRMYDLLQRIPHKSEYVFTSYRGSQISETEFNIMLKKRAALCQIKKPIYAHILRHSRGHDLWNKGFGQDQIAKYLNHKNIDTTSRYVHSNLDNLVALAYASTLEQEKAPSELIGVAKKLLERVYGKLYQINFPIIGDKTVIEIVRI